MFTSYRIYCARVDWKRLQIILECNNMITVKENTELQKKVVTQEKLIKELEKRLSSLEKTVELLKYQCDIHFD